MHLWPSVRIRDSFKIDYLKKLEWNLKRMKSEKESSINQQKLLDKEGNEVHEEVLEAPCSKNHPGFICREIQSVLSCCYSIFCCGDCIDEEEN